MMEKSKHQVRASPGGGETTPADDGHSWRKYGQKEILGAKHPRLALVTSQHKDLFCCCCFLGAESTRAVSRLESNSFAFAVGYDGFCGCHVSLEKAAAPVWLPYA
jgi:hypothetical protein